MRLVKATFELIGLESDRLREVTSIGRKRSALGQAEVIRKVMLLLRAHSVGAS